jgi:hypothetical protein
MIQKTEVELLPLKLSLFTAEPVLLPQTEQRELEAALTQLLLHAATGRKTRKESADHERQDHL